MQLYKKYFKGINIFTVGIPTNKKLTLYSTISKLRFQFRKNIYECEFKRQTNKRKY